MDRSRLTDEQYFAQMERELLGEIEEGYPPSWNFKEEQPTVAGIVVQQRQATFEKDGERKTQKIAVLEVAGGAKLTIWMTSVLLSQFAREKVQIGDFVAIKYEGLKESETGGNSYHNFQVRVRKPDGTSVDWSQTPGEGYGRRSGDSQFVPAGGGGDPGVDADFQGTDDDIPF